jgi:hypothetical protein
MIRISFIVFAVLTFAFVPGCISAGSLSSKVLQNGEHIVIKGETFNEDIDLTDMLEFHPSVSGIMKAEVKGNVIFEKCNFYQFRAFSKKDGKSYMIQFDGDVVFEECLFRDTADFSYMVVEGDFYASRTEFTSVAIFENAWFKGRNNMFTETGFYEKALFNGAMFENRTHFFKTKFSDAAMFQSAVFKGTSFWGAAQFDGYAGFGKSRFLQDLDMGKASFNGRTNFNLMLCLMSVRFNGTGFQEKVDFSGSRFFIDPEFRDAGFESESIGVEEFTDNE